MSKKAVTQVTQAPAKPRRHGQRLADQQRAATQETFLTAFATCGIVRDAAREANVTRKTIYEWRHTDAAFAARYELAEADANDVIRSELRRRAVEGWDEPVYQGGQQVGVIRRYSDTLIRLLAQSRMPEFRDKLDVTSDNEAIGAHGSITQIIADPTTAGLVCDVLQRIGRDATA